MRKQINQLTCDGAFIAQFALDDFKTKYAGSMLGFFWAFIQPIVTVVIYWFIFQLGFKNEGVGEYPFILWLISGLLPWFFVSDSIPNATSCLVEYSYLVKKVLFNINILPLARIVSILFVQLFLLFFTAIFFVAYGFMPSIHWLQIFYYIVYIVLICVGVSYFTSALYIFFRDILQIVSIVLQVIFWTTPIVWQSNIFSEKIQNILSYNPLMYPVRGYRDALMKGNWFWQYDFGQTVYYWLIAVLFCTAGIFVFRTLKHHFADVL